MPRAASQYGLERKLGENRSLAYDQYAELSKQTRLAQANLAVNVVQAELMSQMRNSLVSITNIMDEVRQHQENSLAIQQELLQREQLQSFVEEFIYKTEKQVAEFADPKTEIPTSSRYFLLLGVIETVDQEGIATPLIRGRDNKAAFEKVIAEVRNLVQQLKEDQEVQDAIQWAAAQQRKAEKERKQRSDELNRNLIQLKERLKQVQGRRQKLDAATLIREHFELVKSKLPKSGALRYFAVYLLVCLSLFGWMIYLPWLVIFELPRVDRERNEQVDQEIATLEEEIRSVQSELGSMAM